MDESETEDTWSGKCQLFVEGLGQVMAPDAKIKDRSPGTDELTVNEPFRASRTDIEPDEPAASAETSTSSAGATGEVGSSPSDYRVKSR